MKGTVMVVDDDASHRRLVAHWLSLDGHEVVVAESADACLVALHETVPDTILLDLHMDGVEGFALLRSILARHPSLPIIMLTADGDISTVVQAIRCGAWDYMQKPPGRRRLLTTVTNAVERRGLKDAVETQNRRSAPDGYAGIVGDSTVMRHLFKQIERIGASNITVLVQGESGTGKDLVAQALHGNSLRRTGPFVAVNCAAIPATLQDSTLFGHERGAFTGAHQRHIGSFERANGGTLFLDEVAELGCEAQAKLLRVIQNRSLVRVGGCDEVPLDIRIVAATHSNLREEVEAGRFREDLFYRLAVVEVHVPALRERGEDVIHLAKHFLEQFAPERGLSMPARQLLRFYAWPGNVRELRNYIERASVLADEVELTPSDFPTHVASCSEASTEPPGTLASNEREMILQAIKQADGNLAVVVRTLGIPKSTLYRRLRKYGIR